MPGEKISDFIDEKLRSLEVDETERQCYKTIIQYGINRANLDDLNQEISEAIDTLYSLHKAFIGLSEYYKLNRPRYYFWQEYDIFIIEQIDIEWNGPSMTPLPVLSSFEVAASAYIKKAWLQNDRLDASIIHALLSVELAEAMLARKYDGFTHGRSVADQIMHLLFGHQRVQNKYRLVKFPVGLIINSLPWAALPAFFIYAFYENIVAVSIVGIYIVFFTILYLLALARINVLNDIKHERLDRSYEMRVAFAKAALEYLNERMMYGERANLKYLERIIISASNMGILFSPMIDVILERLKAQPKVF